MFTKVCFCVVRLQLQWENNVYICYCLGYRTEIIFRPVFCKGCFAVSNFKKYFITRRLLCFGPVFVRLLKEGLSNSSLQ